MKFYIFFWEFYRAACTPMFYERINFNGESLKSHSMKSKYYPPGDNFYCAGAVIFTMHASFSVGKFRSTQLRIIDDVQARIAVCDREVKSQHHQKVAHEGNYRTQGKLRFEFLISARRKTGVKRRSLSVELFYVSPVANKMIPISTGTSLTLVFFFLLF